MKKFVVGIFAVGAFCWLTSSYTLAGDLTLRGDAAFTVSREAVEGTDDPLAGVPIGAHILAYTPLSIPLGQLADPTIYVHVDNPDAILTVRSGLQICGPGPTLIAELASGDGTNFLVFKPPAGGSSITNGVDYFFGYIGGGGEATQVSPKLGKSISRLFPDTNTPMQHIVCAIYIFVNQEKVACE